MGDAAANSHTHTAAALRAARLGVANAYALESAETGDCLENKDATRSVPDTLAGALDALRDYYIRFI